MAASDSGCVRWGDVLLASIASVSWALAGMAGVAALGLRLLGADSTASLGPMTAAMVVLGAGGSAGPSGNVEAFGLEDAEASTAVDIAPLGVGLAGALLLAVFFLRSLRGAGAFISGGELAARAGAVAALFVATMGGLAWAGHDVITIDGDQLGLRKIPGNDLPDHINDKLPEGLGDLGGLLPDRLTDLADAKASVGFTVNTAESLVGGACWVLGVLVIALLASRRTPLPRRLDALHRLVRPAASALVTVFMLAVLAGLAAAAYAAVGDDDPKRIAGAALLGAPNGVWLGIPVGLLVPWDGEATGELAKLLPDPVDELFRVSDDGELTLGRLAELDQRVWLLGVAAAVMMLLAGVLAAARTPKGGRPAFGFGGRCAVRLGVVTGSALPLLVWLTDISVDASLSVLGFDAFGAGIELRGSAPMAGLLGAAWGTAAGGLGALTAYVSGAAGRRASPFALGARREDRTYPDLAYVPGPYTPSPGYRPSGEDTNPYLRPPQGVHGAPTMVGPAPPMPPPRPRPRPQAPPTPSAEGPPPPGTPQSPG
ncbi:streptophobe family protein [Streptomyces sp. H27-C3]|uniref:streptophobe family protein n=1 Tax=Streptomyces sp. H27-C3 TaxID=3046305 RepID=UPI0024BB0BCE|nr:streptophobe family protein [Streptomyces sp. H27-C3]MDJ0461878.1 streptophobe family protein [Streptomyces sp. H27-C3]